MKDKAIVEAMARLDGFEGELRERGGGRWKMLFAIRKGMCRAVPAYLTSHDAVLDVFGGLDLFYQQNAMRILIDRVGGKRSDRESRTVVRCVTAKPRTWCEAILKAKGLWEESE